MVDLARNGKRCPWAAMQVRDDLHTLLAGDNRRAGDVKRARWHIDVRDQFRRCLDDAASIWCGRPVTGYTGGQWNG